MQNMHKSKKYSHIYRSVNNEVYNIYLSIFFLITLQDSKLEDFGINCLKQKLIENTPNQNRTHLLLDKCTILN